MGNFPSFYFRVNVLNSNYFGVELWNYDVKRKFGLLGCVRVTDMQRSLIFEVILTSFQVAMEWFTLV